MPVERVACAMVRVAMGCLCYYFVPFATDVLEEPLPCGIEASCALDLGVWFGCCWLVRLSIHSCLVHWRCTSPSPRHRGVVRAVVLFGEPRLGMDNGASKLYIVREPLEVGRCYNRWTTTHCCIC